MPPYNMTSRGLRWPKFAYLCMCVGEGSQKCPFWEFKKKMLQTIFCASNASKSHLHIWGSKIPIWGLKNAKICNLIFAPNASKWLFGVSHDQNEHIWEGQKCPFCGSKMPKCAKTLFCSKWPETSFGDLPWPKFAKSAYWGGQKCPCCGSKMPKFAQFLCAPNAPKCVCTLWKL